MAQSSPPHPDRFFEVRVHLLEKASGLTAVCAGYELREWRHEQLAGNLIKWLPEFALTYSELQRLQGYNAADLIAKAARSVYMSDKYKKRGEIGELLLHVICREVFKTYPAITKYFYKDSSNDTVKGFDAVHVVVTKTGLELWLGESKFYEDIDQAISAASLLMQIDDEDLTARSKKRLEAFLNQEFLDYETLRRNVGIDPQAQIEIAREIGNNLRKYAPILQWRGMPRYEHIYAICELIWKPFHCQGLGAGSAVSPKQLAFKLIELQKEPTTRALIQQAFAYFQDADEAVKQVLDFLKLWANFHFPQFLRALDRIQKDVFRRAGMPSGNYDVYASKVENRFIDPPIIALEEYGIPLEVALKLRRHLRPYENLDTLLENLRRLRIEKTNFGGFERSVIEDAQRTL
jgi:hypothetical protein